MRRRRWAATVLAALVAGVAMAVPAGAEPVERLDEMLVDDADDVQLLDCPIEAAARFCRSYPAVEPAIDLVGGRVRVSAPDDDGEQVLVVDLSTAGAAETAPEEGERRFGLFVWPLGATEPFVELRVVVPSAGGYRLDVVADDRYEAGLPASCEREATFPSPRDLTVRFSSSCWPASPFTVAIWAEMPVDEYDDLYDQINTSGLVAVDAVRTRAERVAGPTRYDTAAAIADEVFTAADVIYLARGTGSPADALAGGALTDGPLLLVPPQGQVPDPVRRVVGRLDPREVVALGGPSAISDSMLAAVADGRATRRLAGADRFETAAQVAEAAFPDGAPAVHVSRGVDPLVDAVAAGTLEVGPVLLVPTTGPVPDAVRDAIASLDPERVVAIGGTAAVPEAVLDAVASGRETDRYAGADRYATAAAVATARTGGAASVYLARAHGPLVDALAGGMVTDGPVLLVPEAFGVLPMPAVSAIHRLAPGRVVALGGTSAVGDSTLLDGAAVDGTPGSGPILLDADGVDGLAPGSAQGDVVAAVGALLGPADIDTGIQPPFGGNGPCPARSRVLGWTFDGPDGTEQALRLLFVERDAGFELAWWDTTADRYAAGDVLLPPVWPGEEFHALDVRLTEYQLVDDELGYRWTSREDYRGVFREEDPYPIQLVSSFAHPCGEEAWGATAHAGEPGALRRRASARSAGWPSARTASPARR